MVQIPVFETELSAGLVVAYIIGHFLHLVQEIGGRCKRWPVLVDDRREPVHRFPNYTQDERL
nr:hypothetical protein [Halobacterium salinarum]